jgi:hypothetical protein
MLNKDCSERKNELKSCIQYIEVGIKFIGHEIKECTELAEHEMDIHNVMSVFKSKKCIIER